MFRFVFIKLSQSHDPSHKFCMLTKVDLGCFMVPWPRSIQYVVILIYFFLNMSSWLFSTSNCIFTSRLDYLWTHRVNRVPSDQLSHFYFCLKFELHNFKLIYLWIWIEIIFVKLICMYVCMYVCMYEQYIPGMECCNAPKQETYCSNWENRTPTRTEFTTLV